ncbi:response regulator [Desulfobacca acetoxidans]|uniref:histidine kinase n=1 Tax=Desulfobacca acetoxidans (strain ATCC 700848 / DSM 11109 / ASRB2) TaxID=880072 RepID=F2NFZ0_DESAR|nr:response regulator [Desulfobacca acetoxidans]AEB08403.1 multi-sensor hybrid histidine kinase [Desulfobacca acetoxidans DSM 11109]
MDKKRILIAEDEAIVAEDIRRTLEKFGYQVVGMVSSGAEVLAKTAEFNPDLVLMDIVLQGKMNGIEAAEVIQTRHQTPVIFLTAYADAATLERAKVTEPFGYILKPFEDQSLHTAIEIALYKSQAQKRIAHLNAVLRAVRNVNQLIVREQDLDRLIQQACRLLVETRGYHQAWIFLLDSDLEIFKTATAGSAERDREMLELLEQRLRPGCIGFFHQPGLTILSVLADSCPTCPLRQYYEKEGAFITRLEIAGEPYGLMGVALPQAMLGDVEEQSLFQEVAGDLAFAIHGIYLTEKNRLAEEERRQTEARLHAIFSYAPNVAIQGFDRQGRMLFWNKAAEAIFGRPEINGVADIFDDLLTDKNGRQNLKMILAEVDRTGLPYGPQEFVFHNPAGHQGIAKATIFSIPVEQGSKEFICMSVDITDLKQEEENRVKLEAQLRQTQKMEAIGTLAGGIAHDFNNILAALLGYTELSLLGLDLEPDQEQIRKNLEAVIQAGNRARDLVRQILTFSRQSEEKQKPVQVSLVVQEALKFLRPSIPTTIEIQAHLDAKNGDDMVWADPAQIYQVVMNLCTNAYQAMQERGGILRVSLTNILLRNEPIQTIPQLQEGSYVKLTVRDTGQGMDAWVKDRIFEPYFTTKKPGEGTGLGLSVIHGIVMHLNGAIVVYSEPGRGSTFQIYLPHWKGTSVPRLDYAASIPRGQERILVVDDEPPIADLVQQLLQRLGYQVTAVTNSQEALKIFQANPDAFDLVITDLTMPHLTGLELSRKILQRRADLPIILCSGYSDITVAAEMRKIGIKEYLMKPISARTYGETIRRILATSKE